ncbi:MAG: YceD family protein [Oligoflexia bacterium]
MRIYLHEITEQGTEVTFGPGPHSPGPHTKDAWAEAAVSRADEISELAPAQKSSRPLEGRLTLRKVDDVVVIDGRIQTELHLLCSRCATPFSFACAPSFQTLFCRDPATAGVAHLDKDKQGRTTGKVVGRLQGRARHAHDFEGENQKTSDLDITYLSEDWIELEDVLTEQVQLLVPFQPLCKEDCKGICAHCGADLNKGRCACSKLQKQSPFSALKSLRFPASK